MVMKSEHTALYKQVYEYMLSRIQTGEWAKDRRLPSVRSLAELLGVHRLTILKAYQLLKEEGHVYAKDKTGYYCKNSNLLSEAGEQPAIYSYIQNSHLSDIHREQTSYKFSAAVIDPTLLPNRYLSQHAKEIFDRYPHLLGTYAPVKGDDELITGLSAYFQKYDRLYIHEDSIVVTSGAQQGIDIIAKVFVQAHDYVLIESPTYSGAADIFVNRGAKLIPVPINSAGFCLEELESLMKKHRPKLFYTNPTYQNPTGYTVPIDQRKQLAELAEKYQCIILEDDSFHEIYFHESPPPPPIFAYDTGGYVIYLRSFCKYMAPGLRICAMVAHPSLIKWLIKGKALADNGTPLLNQKAFLFYLTSDRVRTHMEKLRIALQIRKETMEAQLKNHFKWDSPGGGLNLWVRLDDTMDKAKLKDRAFASSVSYVPGYICDPLERDIPYIRLSYSFLNEQDIKNGMGLLTNIYDSLLNEIHKPNGRL